MLGRSAIGKAGKEVQSVCCGLADNVDDWLLGRTGVEERNRRTERGREPQRETETEKDKERENLILLFGNFFKS